ncbi:MAG: protein-S-isoprenylcysteine O-methyltransferase [Anaerolineales bacterium]
MLVFKIVYWAGMIIEVVVRAPFERASKAAAKTHRRASRAEDILLGLLTVFLLVVPLVYSVTNWLDFANYSLPAWMGWLGVFLLACSVLVFARAHIDLKSNWSPTLEIHKDHALVTTGIYRYVRHPMYTSLWLWAIAQILLMQNGLAGPLNLIFFALFYFLRVPAEEKMMLDTFGDQYREYMKKVGGVIPKWPVHHN